jgi:hypothetical protein
MIATERLELVPATLELTRAALAGQRTLAMELGAAVPASWPLEFLDPRAPEAVRGLLARAFDVPAVHHVVAETMPELIPSIGVLRKCGFRLISEGSEPGVIRFELTRAEHSMGKGAT